MKLVDHLRALLSQFVSKKDGEFISTQGLSTDTFIELSKPTVNGAQTFVAPCNGFLNIGTEARGNVESAGIASWGQIDVTQQYDNQVGYAQDAIIIPLKRGNTLYFSSGGAYRFVRFYKMYGGGNSILSPILRSIQGGLLCLRNTCKLYLTPSLVRQSTISCLALQSALRYKLRLKHQSFKKSQLRAMVSLLSMFGMLKTFLSEMKTEAQGVGTCGDLTQMVAISEERFRATKASRLLLNGKRQKALQKSMVQSIFSPKMALGNLSFGGALC